MIEADFTPEQRRDFTVRREISWASATVDWQEIDAVELRYIRELRSNDLATGYSRWPRMWPCSMPSPLRLTGPRR